VGELRERKLWLDELSSLITQDSLWSLNDSLDNEDVFSLSTMSTSHLIVHLGNSSAESIVSVFFIHVHNSSS